MDAYLMDILHTVGTIIVIVGFGWKANLELAQRAK